MGTQPLVQGVFFFDGCSTLSVDASMPRADAIREAVCVALATGHMQNQVADGLLLQDRTQPSSFSSSLSRCS